MFLVRGIVDKTNEITNKKVILTRLKNVRLESSNSPNETVMYEINFYSTIIYQFYFSNNLIFAFTF